MKLTVGCIFAMCSLCTLAGTNLIVDVVASLREIREDYGGRFPRSGMIREDWRETRIETNESFRTLRCGVTNQWNAALQQLLCVTNQDDRLIVMAACAAHTEEEYINRVGYLAAMAISNQLSTVEFQFFKNRCAVANHFAASVLVRRYNEPMISNLIMKVNSAGGFPSGVDSIFTGEEKQLYEEAVEEGMVGP